MNCGTISDVLSKEFEIVEGTSVDMNAKSNQGITTKKEPYSLQAFLDQMTKENMNHEIFDDGLVGSEEWTLLYVFQK